MGYADQGEEDDWSKAQLSPEQPDKAKKEGKSKPGERLRSVQPACRHRSGLLQGVWLVVGCVLTLSCIARQARRPRRRQSSRTRRRSNALPKCFPRQPSAARQCAMMQPPVRPGTSSWTASSGIWGGALPLPSAALLRGAHSCLPQRALCAPSTLPGQWSGTSGRRAVHAEPQAGMPLHPRSQHTDCQARTCQHQLQHAEHQSPALAPARPELMLQRRRPATLPQAAARAPVRPTPALPRPQLSGPSRLASTGGQAPKRQRTGVDVEDALAGMKPILSGGAALVQIFPVMLHFWPVPTW